MDAFQKNKICRLTTPLEEDLLLVARLQGREGISELFRFELNLVSTETDINFGDLIGKSITVEIELTEGITRLVNGVVSRFCQVDTPDVPVDEEQLMGYYWAEIVPWPWFLTRRKDCRIFQNKTVQEIVEEVFGNLDFTDFDFRLSSSYDPLVNCVQYEETDFSFVSRLLESAGIFYFFEHEDNRHVMVLADSPDQNVAVPDLDSALYTTGAKTGGGEERVHSWRVEEVLQPGQYALTDFNFFDPATELLVNSQSTLAQPGAEKFEIFDYPGGFVNLGGEEGAKLAKGESLVKLRMEEGDARAVKATGTTNCRAFLPGFVFPLDGHPRADFNKQWLLTTVVHDLDQRAALIQDTDTPAQYGNRISAMPYGTAFRPAMLTPRPRIPGAQTALVVGPDGEEIYVDKLGRVKIQFSWDRYGQSNENSSCWVRVSQNWAGKQWGILFHPRMGQEVVVEFLDGDPDRPLITGRVYNASQPIPFEGPTQSGILTRSTAGGSAENFNQIRFEDQKDQEEIYLHAEKDMKRVVENDDKEDVGANQTSSVTANKTVSVGKNHDEKIGEARTLSVGKSQDVKIGAACNENVGAAMSLSVGKDYTESVGKNKSVSVSESQAVDVGKDAALTVGGQNSVSVGKGHSLNVGKNLAINVDGGSAYETKNGWTLKAKKISIEAKDELSIKVGSAEFTLKKNGDINLKGKKINVKGSGDLILKGSKIDQN